VAIFAAALLYAAAVLGANGAQAQTLDDATRDSLQAIREGQMRKLTLHDEPVPADQTPFTDLAGVPHTLAESNGRIRLVNFWATWCAPCRQEKPALDALQAELGGPDFEVIAIATGRNRPEAIEEFNAEVGIEHLTTYLDPKSKLAEAMGVPGLPVTVILNREGAEIGRMMGGGNWDSPSARGILTTLIALKH